MKRTILLKALLMVLTAPVVAADSPWVEKVVLADYGGKPVTGKIVRSMGCLYVLFDQAQPGGVRMARIADSIQGLRIRSGKGWVAQDLQTLRQGEADRCFDGANG